MSEKISIIIPVFNARNFLENLFLNIQAQDYKNLEIIFIDDNSNDNSKFLIESFKEKDGRVKLICLKENSGPGIARDKGLENSTGDYIAFLDVDDSWTPDKLALQVNFMKKNKYLFTYHDYSIKKNGKLKEIKNTKETTFDKLLVSRPIALFTVMISREIIKEISFYHENRNYPEDLIAWFGILKQHNAINVEKNLGTYLSTNQSRSGKKIKSSYFAFKVYRDVLGFNFFKSLFFWIIYFLFSLRKHYI